MSENLKPCPFCGSDKIEDQNNPDWPGMVWCTNCGYGMSYEEVGSELVMRDWNTRPIEDALRAENQRLKDAAWLAHSALNMAIGENIPGDTAFYLSQAIDGISAALAGEEAQA